MHQLLDCRRFAVSPLVCLVLIAFMGGRRVDEAFAELQEVSPASAEELQRAVEFLLKSELLVRDDHSGHQLAMQLTRQWAHYGWREAADYHLASFDYRFLDYAGDGPSEDSWRMYGYRKAEPEPNRTKRYGDAMERQPLLSAKEAVLALKTPFPEAWAGPAPANQLDRERLEQLMVIVFGQFRSRFVIKGIPNLVRKVSPSGGGRHPTEGYVVVRSVPCIDPGVYHFAVAENALERIGDALSDEQIARMFYGLVKAPFDPQAFVIFTSVFERNMYRYREPRTFRTIFMDIGHLTGTLQVVARTLGVQCHAHHAIDDHLVGSLLRLDRLTEGVLYGAALGGEVTAHEYDENHRGATARV